FGPAAQQFRIAEAAFSDANAGIGGAIVRAEGHVPYLGRTPRTVSVLAEIGNGLSGAGGSLAERVGAFPNGLRSILTGQGRLSVAGISALAGPVHRARLQIEAADAMARELPNSLVAGPVADARDLVRAKLRTALGDIVTADVLLRTLPRFAGADGIRRYFVAAQNNAELRGTGGYISEYAILTADHGSLELSPFLGEVGSLPSLPLSKVPAPSAEFAEMYDRFGGASFWPNINMTPDVPTAGSLIETLYRKVRGVRLDGVIFLDPGALADM